MESWKSEVIRNGSVSYSCVPSWFYSLVKSSCITMIADWRKNWPEGLQRYVFFIRCDWLLSPLLNAKISVCRLWMAVQSLLMAIQSLLMYIQRLQTEISDGLFGKDCSLLWWSHLAAFVKRRRFFGKLTAFLWQTLCASLAMSLRFLGKVTALLGGVKQVAGFLWWELLGKCSAVRGEAWQSFFASRMLVGRSGKLLAGGSFRIGAVCVTSKKGNLMPRKIQMKRFGNWRWNAPKIANGLV